MLTLYATAESLYCAKLRLLLRHKKAAWQEVAPAGGCGSDSYRRMIPTGTMPALVDDDLVLADSEAIAEYLEECIPRPPMLPRDPVARARCRERSRFHDTRLEPELRRLFPHISPASRDPGIVGLQTEMLQLRLAELARLLTADATLDTSCLTLGDCGMPITFAWIDAFVPILGLTLEWPQSLRDYRRQIEQHAAVREELAAYAAGMQEWLQSKIG